MNDKEEKNLKKEAKKLKKKNEQKERKKERKKTEWGGNKKNTQKDCK